MIKRIRITNFKSLTNVDVALDPVTVLIGRSGTGKSNFVEALRWLRDYLRTRSDQALSTWPGIMSATSPKPMSVTFALTFDAPGFTEDYQYELRFQQAHETHNPHFMEEQLSLGSRVLFHQREGKWLQPPPLVNPPALGQVMLGGLTGVQEATIAYLVLTAGIGCYAFPDDILLRYRQAGGSDEGLSDNGDNFLRVFTAIQVNLQTWEHLREISASLRLLKPSLKNLDLQLPQRQQITVTHEVGDKLLVFDLAQESEGFRRLLALLLALYQTPPKQTLVFDEPEKGVYPDGLAVLADEFKAYASKGRGQVLLTTHSPEFLDHFEPEQIRVVEMRNYQTQIGPVSSEQMANLREHYLEPRELLSVDRARLEGSLAEAQ